MQKPFSTKSSRTMIMRKFGKILLLFITSASLASAQVIVSDNFDRNGNLNGSSPTVGAGTWTVGTNGSGDTITTSTAGGGQADSANTTAGDITVNGVLPVPTAYLTSPGGSLKDGTYTLSLTMSNPGPQPSVGVLFGLGALGNPNVNPWNLPANNNLMMASVNLRGSDPSDAVIFQGPALANYSTLPITPGAPTTFALTFDVSNTAAWTLSATVNGTPILFGGNPVYTYPFIGDPNKALVGLPANDLFITEYGATTGTFQNLVFAEVSVPEPSTWAMMLAGIAFLGFCVRRKRV